MVVDRRAATVAKELNRCRHFNGVMNPRCDAGVAYADVRDAAAAGFRYPCFADSFAAADCLMRAFPSQAEAEAEVDRRHREAVALLAVAAAAHEDAGKRGLGRGRPGAGECPCPCGGQIHYAVAGNGHMRGRCGGPCGAAWME